MRWSAHVKNAEPRILLDAFSWITLSGHWDGIIQLAV
jgi:hypothetical protein